jgi:hypothetical protein
LVSRRIECRRSMHDWEHVTSKAFAAVFPLSGTSVPDRAIAMTVKRGASRARTMRML